LSTRLRRSIPKTSRDLEAGRQPRVAQVDAVAAHRNTFPKQKVALAPSLRKAPVRANHTMPWEAFVSGGKNPAHQAGRLRVDVAIGADKSNRNRAHAVKDSRCAGGSTLGFGHLGTDGRIPMRG
jgi:hypothetical protein